MTLSSLGTGHHKRGRWGGRLNGQERGRERRGDELMPVYMSDDDGRGEPAEQRDYPSLYITLCDCAGPQPSLTNRRADEHDPDCPYRRAVEGDAEELR